MRQITRRAWASGIALLSALSLLGCGGGNDSLAPKTSVSQVYVMGDSLADVGTFGGLKFTVMDPVTPGNSAIWTQIIANQFGLDGLAQCSFFSIAVDFSVATNSRCSNYAVGGARIVDTSVNHLPTVIEQLALRGTAAYAATDLLLVDGGGNDAADLIVASANPGNFQSVLRQQFSAEQVTQLLTTDPTGNAAAVAYMQALANKLYDTIESQALNRGATRVAVLNIPDVTITPRFVTIQGTPFQTAFRAWISAFNSQLKARAGSDRRVAIVDFYADFQDEIANPANYGLSNVTAPACTEDKSELFGNFPCLSTELDAMPDKTPGWWKTYAFSDGFHPTPYGHQLLAASVSRALARAGWL